MLTTFVNIIFFQQLQRKPNENQKWINVIFMLTKKVYFYLSFIGTYKTNLQCPLLNWNTVNRIAFFVQNFRAKPNVTREKLPKRRLYKKRARKTLMKLTPGGLGGLKPPKKVSRIMWMALENVWTKSIERNLEKKYNICQGLWPS